MPELPEVHTTATELNRLISGLAITDVWSEYRSVFHEGKQNIKDAVYFQKFRKEIVTTSVLRVRRRAKNVLIDLSSGTTVLIHMKMTGHLLFGTYKKTSDQPLRQKPESFSIPPEWEQEVWIPSEPRESALWDPFNRFIHLVISLSNGKHLVLSDVRKFAKILYFPTAEESMIPDLKNIGPEPFDLTPPSFAGRLLLRPNGPIKQVLMDQRIIAGIGNIYSDEILWQSGIHPLSLPARIPTKLFKKMFSAMREILAKGIDFGGDSTSDYRAPNGSRGQFHHHHMVYRETGTRCKKHGCSGIIERKVIGGRSGHFCPVHQTRF